MCEHTEKKSLLNCDLNNILSLKKTIYMWLSKNKICFIFCEQNNLGKTPNPTPL